MKSNFESDIYFFHWFKRQRGFFHFSGSPLNACNILVRPGQAQSRTLEFNGASLAGGRDQVGKPPPLFPRVCFSRKLKSAGTRRDFESHYLNHCFNFHPLPQTRIFKGFYVVLLLTWVKTNFSIHKEKYFISGVEVSCQLGLSPNYSASSPLSYECLRGSRQWLESLHPGHPSGISPALVQSSSGCCRDFRSESVNGSICTPLLSPHFLHR